MRFLPTILLFTTLFFQANAHSIRETASPAGDSLTLDRYIIVQNIKAERTPEGVFFTAHTEGVGKEPQQGDFVKIRYTGKLLSGEVFDESPKNEPFAYQFGTKQVIEGWDIALKNLRVGAKVTIYVPAKLAYGTLGIGTIVPPNTPLMYDIELVAILTPPQYQEHLRGIEDAEKHAFMERIAEQLVTDQRAINEYGLNHKLKLKRTENGISYIITKKGEGHNVKAGGKVSFTYEGRLLNNHVFDATKENMPLTITINEGNTIAGLEEGLTAFSEGSEGYILIPSKFGYGSLPYENGKVVIAGNSALVFRISVLSVK
ncbi:MAG: FKBP-type peptidyl-prolyl cis-trans isomerase [Saprospiraceae bacterium]|nr:FKBP-type peptidyl-prolyl cis-trans isomerase [Saprospiraceae bacterium]